MKQKKFWIIGGVVVLLAVAGYFWATNFLPLQQTGSQVNAQSAPSMETTTIRPATDAAQVSAAGNIALQTERPVVLEVDGIVTTVNADVGDVVANGDVLLTLDTTDLERTVETAKLSLQSAQANLDKLTEAASAEDIASAQASLASAQENLLDVQAGPSAEELAAAEANLQSAQAKYQDLLDGPSDAELTQLSANMEKARISLQQAQWNYDKVAYSDSVGSSPQAAQLQQATIDYESAKAAYEQATESAGQADVQSAWSAVQTAQKQLDDLKAKPTAAELASAEAQVASAAANLENLLNGASAAELQSAQISVEKAKLDLQQAEENLAKAKVVAPIDGTVLAANVVEGQRVSQGLTAFTLADIGALELTVNVAEVDISKIALGQQAEITVDALPDRTFSGEVTRIAPSSTATSGVVNYPVTIAITDDDLSGIRPGMTAVATIFSGDSSQSSWLVPSAAVRERNGNTMVLVLRNGEPTPVQVEKTGTQGEWTIVVSPDLKAGDEAVGAVNLPSQQNSQQGGFMRPPGMGPGNGSGQRPQ